MLAENAALLHRFSILNVNVEQLFTDASSSEFKELSISAKKYTSHLSFRFTLDNFVYRADIFAHKGYFCVVNFEQIGASSRRSSHKVKLCLLV